MLEITSWTMGRRLWKKDATKCMYFGNQLNILYAWVLMIVLFNILILSYVLLTAMCLQWLHRSLCEEKRERRMSISLLINLLVCDCWKDGIYSTDNSALMLKINQIHQHLKMDSYSQQYALFLCTVCVTWLRCKKSSKVKCKTVTVFHRMRKGWAVLLQRHSSLRYLFCEG